MLSLACKISPNPDRTSSCTVMEYSASPADSQQLHDFAVSKVQGGSAHAGQLYEVVTAQLEATRSA